jgi:HlyD family secretion protein
MSSVTTEPRARPAPAPQPAPPPRRRFLRWLVPLALLLGVVGFAVWRFESVPAEGAAELVLLGNIDVRQVNLAFKVPGRLETLFVDEGDAVKAGQVVATLDERYFRDDLRLARAQRDQAAANLEKLEHGSRPEEIAQARAQLAQQQANLALARANLKRGEVLAPSGGMSKEDLDQRRQAVGVGEANVNYARETLRLAEVGPRQEDIAAARAQLRAEEARVVQVEQELTDCKLLAPNDGIILTRAREKGAILQAGETVFTLTLASPVWVRTYVGEPDLGLVRPGMAATVWTDSQPDQPYHARVGFISPTAEFTPKTVETRELRTDLVYRLRVVVDDPDGGLRQGMPVTVRLQLPGPRPKSFWQRVREALYLDRLLGPGQGR